MRDLDLPPMLSGSSEQQLRQLRDYLIRLVQSLNEEDEKQAKNYADIFIQSCSDILEKCGILISSLQCDILHFRKGGISS